MMTRVRAHGYVVVSDRFGLLAPAKYSQCARAERGVLFAAGRRVYPFKTRREAEAAIRRTRAFAVRRKFTEWLKDRSRVICITADHFDVRRP